MTAAALSDVEFRREYNRLLEHFRTAEAEGFPPPPALTVSQWADANQMVGSYSADPGQWVTDKTPYLREIMDVFNDPAVNRVVFKKCARIGGTEAGLNVVGYFIDHDPSPILIVQPTVDDAKDFSKEQLAPMIEETPPLAKKVSAARAKDSKNTIQAKVFAGGGLYLVGANSPSGFRRRTARIIVLEEVDGYPQAARTKSVTEGDQVKLAERRATTFQHRRKVYLNSTPTIKGLSRIEKEHERSDQRRYFVPCPFCQHEQPFEWRNLQWDEGQPATAAYMCAGCAVLIPESEKFGMVQRGRWIATNPGHTTVGFHLNALYSPWVRWSELAEEWIAAQDDAEKRQVFVNTALGESYEDRGGGLDPEHMWANRREAYTLVPLAAGLLTAGIDVQHDRLEIVVRAWGVRWESWLMERKIIVGDPTADEVWRLLDAYLLTAWPHESGAAVRIHTACIDCGDNYHRVLQYAAPRFGRRVFATKGASDPATPFLPKRPSRNNKYRCPIFLLGTNTAKGIIYDRLKIQGEHVEAPAAGKYHFNESADRDYFDQLTVEKAERKYVNRRWARVFVCPDHRRNEVLDCEVMALAAANLSGYAEQQLGALAQQVVAIHEHKEAAKRNPPGPTKPLPGARKPQSNNWLNRHKRW
jgi:phage terminase large subunit GpA-like protein